MWRRACAVFGASVLAAVALAVPASGSVAARTHASGCGDHVRRVPAGTALDKALANAPEREADGFCVPKIIE